MTDPLERLAREQCGVFTFGQAEGLGYTRSMVQRLVAQGDWVRVRRSAYAYRAAWQTAEGNSKQLHQMQVAAVLLDNPRAVASHTSAARLLDVSHLWSWPVAVTITVPPAPDHRIPASRTGLVDRRIARLPDDHVAPAGMIRYTTAARTVVDLARDLRFVEAVVVTDGMLHRKLTTKEEASAVFAFMSEFRNRKAVDRVLAFADSRAESVLESYGRVRLHEHGVTGGEPQVWLYDAEGPIGRVDLYFPAHRTVVEFDGLMKYDGDEGALRREKLRQERLEQAGFVVVRITFNQVRYEPARTAARVADAFARAARLPPTGWAGPAPDWARV